MEYMDATKEKFSKIEILGIPALFTNKRVDQENLPKDVYCYSLRHGDDDEGLPSAIESYVRVNYFGAILTVKPIEFGSTDYIPLKYDDIVWGKEKMNLVEFQNAMVGHENEGMFYYEGFHFVPTRTFTKKERDMSLVEISKFLADDLISDRPYTYQGFYDASGNSFADVFHCVETGKDYVPCNNRIFEYRHKQELDMKKAR